MTLKTLQVYLFDDTVTKIVICEIKPTRNINNPICKTYYFSIPNPTLFYPIMDLFLPLSRTSSSFLITGPDFLDVAA